MIPPYYRNRHRPNITVHKANTKLESTTVAQLRFLKLSVQQTKAGLNGWETIKEEKAYVSTMDDYGDKPISALEIAVKLASRQLLFNRTGADSPESLDDGNRCAKINQAAYEWALSTVHEEDRERFIQHGVPLVMVNDTKPTPPAGPWWIYNYLTIKPNPDNHNVEIGSFYAFYSLSASPYGAGNHYCKLLSPARAMEWILVDGLRQ
mmetsp:Transcript_1152/g.1932  ORF Transcript_1152/g.1932 Transcript_1152/m.1932 type:complete len:207 (-) Transcript_1152:541-1161(-)